MNELRDESPLDETLRRAQGGDLAVSEELGFLTVQPGHREKYPLQLIPIGTSNASDAQETRLA